MATRWSCSILDYGLQLGTSRPSARNLLQPVRVDPTLPVVWNWAGFRRGTGNVGSAIDHSGPFAADIEDNDLVSIAEFIDLPVFGARA